MSNFVEKNLNRNEKLLASAKLHPIHLIVAWIWGILGFWLVLIPTIKAIKATIAYFNTELSVTDKRVIGKVGFIQSKSLDAPLNKLSSVSASSGFFGKIFHYGTVIIKSGDASYEFSGIKDADQFKSFVMNQIDEYENDKIKAQAQQMAAAMTSVMR